MEFVKRYWTQIRAQLEGLNGSQKWAIATTLVLALLLVGILVLYSAQPEQVAITGFVGGNSGQVLAHLQQAGIDATIENGQILVPKADKDRALALLVQSDLLNSDTSAAFNELIKNQSPWQTSSQSEQAYMLAKQTVLGKIIGKMKGVRSASVLISVPRNKGFGRTYIHPTASVTIWMAGGASVPQRLVEAVARLSAGAVAGMRAQDVSVTDANFGRTRTVRSEDDQLPSDMLEFVHKLEQYHREKIVNVLSYIPGVIVGVNVQVDPTQQKVQQSINYQENQPLESEQTRETTRKSEAPGGEPGARSNAGITIAGTATGGTTEHTTDSQTNYIAPQIIHKSQSTETGHQIKQINVTVNVPRGYFVGVYDADHPKAKTPPTDQQLQPIVQKQLALIQSQITPLVQAQAVGVIETHMIPDRLNAATVAAASATSGGVVTLLDSNWAKPVGVGLLAALSLGMMLMMVRKATRPEPMPSMEELAGVPPALNIEEELVGDAEPGDAAMMGVELNDDELRSRKIAEQISDMIKANPNEAGGILGKWVRSET